MVLASSLLDGRRATTHWRYCGELAHSYPAVDVIPDVLYVDSGDLLSSGGVAAGIDLCLHLVRQDFGADVANRLARRLVVGPYRDGGQAQFVEHPVQVSLDGPIKPTLVWALDRLDKDLSIEQLARFASMSRRTFHRYFLDRTGTRPHRWLIAQRVLLVYRLLETTDLAVDEVARRSGFGRPPP